MIVLTVWIIFNMWIICGLISYFRVIYIDKFHEEEIDIGLPQNYNKLIIFITCIIGGVLGLIYLLWFDLQMLWISIKYWIGTLYDKVFKK